MRVTKRADLLRKIRAEEEARRFARTYQEDSLEAVCLDLFTSNCKALELILDGVPYREEVHGELLAQMRGFAARMEALCVEIEIS